MTRPNRLRIRPGFTLVELMTVILIIGLLAAILLPAIQGAVNTAKDAAVVAEINQLSQALTTFKNQFGDYPPSRIMLCENTYYNTASTVQLDDSSITWYANGTGGVANYPAPTTNDDLTYGQLATRSLSYLRKFWGRAQALDSASGSTVHSAFQTNSALALSTSPTFWPDFNGNGVCDASPILLQGPECLAFFLGGLPSTASSTTNFAQGGGMTGFSKSPLYPFVNDAIPNQLSATIAAPRVTPLFEFKGDRLMDDDLDGIPGYTDTIGSISGGTARYYAYFSAYGQTATTGGYDPNDNNLTDELGILASFRTTFPAGPAGSQSNVVQSPGPNPYSSSVPSPGSATVSVPATYLNGQTFQILSAGRDRVFGFGGQYLPNATTQRLPVSAGMSGTYQGDTLSDRAYERDNLTNFHGTKLD